ncbi:MAG TPA: ParA family protein [Isosphaeraceae bacterium]|nr:ParA family protein [Isosphaeraceae bacterium]
MPVISAVALKGGVGKTTFVHMTAGALATMGRRVLCLDNDAQASLSSGMFGPSVVERLDPAETIAALYAGDDPLPEEIIRPSGIDGIDIVPGSSEAADYNTPKPQTAPVEIQTCLRTFVDEVQDRYDVVLIDNPPQLSAATWAALVASDYLTVQTVPEDYGSASLSPVFKIVQRMTAGPNPRLHMLGLILTMVQPRLAVHQLYEASLREMHGAGVFDARIPIAADIKEAIMRRLPVTHHKPRGASSKAFRAVVEEIFERIERHRAGDCLAAKQEDSTDSQTTSGEAA